MREQGVAPDAVTFVALLSAFAHVGLVDQAQEYFRAMQTVYRIVPEVAHYSCLVSAFARKGLFSESKKWIREMESVNLQPDVPVWMSLLAPAVTHGEVGIAREAFSALKEIDPLNGAAICQIEGLYRRKGMHTEANEIKLLKNQCRDLKEVTKSWWFNAIQEKLYEFYPGNEDNDYTRSVMRMKASLSENYGFKEDGDYDHRCSHSELLALACALLSSPAGSTVRIFKKMQTCGSCHSFFKLMSMVEGRPLFLKDVNRFHKFENNKCSCNDFWVQAELLDRQNGLGEGQTNPGYFVDCWNRLAPFQEIQEERKWKKFFEDPTFWWDNRFNKRARNHPDFKHVSTGESLWLDSNHRPEWVAEKLQTLAEPPPQKVSITARFKQGLGNSMSTKDCHQQQQNRPVSLASLLDALKLAATNRDLESGKWLHDVLMRNEQYHSRFYVWTALVDMYAKCGKIDKACEVFSSTKERDSNSYNVIMMGCNSHGKEEKTLEYFWAMGGDANCAWDDRSFVAAIAACASVAKRDKVVALEKGVQIHALAKAKKLVSDVFVGNSLVDMYANCGDLQNARLVFDEIPHKNVVSWNALIHGYVINGEWELALDVYRRMIDDDGSVEPNARTYGDVLTACGKLMALDTGRRIHATAKDKGLLHKDAILATCLVDFYGKCGDTAAARQAFDDAGVFDDPILWGVLLEAYSVQGQGFEALELFRCMERHGCQATDVTFVWLLKACSRACLVDKGEELFREMVEKFGISPSLQHYTCMIHLFGRANKLEKALQTLRSMPFEADLVAWMALLAACRKRSNEAIGKVAFDALVELDKSNGTQYVLMANIYGNLGKLEERNKVLEMRKMSGAFKKPGKSWWTDEEGRVHTFLVGDITHPQTQDIYAKLKELSVGMKAHGYVPDLVNVLTDASSKEKEDLLCGHSEKLSIACAIANSAPRTTIRVVKNLRVCEDCHAATAIISKLENRRIICRDANQLHVFDDGKCSCGDLW